MWDCSARQEPGWVRNLEVIRGQRQLKDETTRDMVRTLEDCTIGGMGSKSRSLPRTVQGASPVSKDAMKNFCASLKSRKPQILLWKCLDLYRSTENSILWIPSLSHKWPPWLHYKCVKISLKSTVTIMLILSKKEFLSYLMGIEVTFCKMKSPGN